MKALLTFIFLITCGLGDAWSATISGNLKGLDIKSCISQSQKCIRLKSPEAMMSQFLPLYTFKKFDIQITENNVLKKISGSFGYMDLVNKLIVLRPNGSTSDYSIHMDTLTEKDYSL